MEISDLKTIWNKSKGAISEEHQNVNEMEKMIRNKSNLTIERVKRDLRRKGYFYLFLGAVVLILMFKVYFFEEPELRLWDSLSHIQYTIFVSSMGLVTLMIGGYMLLMIKKISNEGNRNDSLRMSLSRITYSIKKMMNVNSYSDAIGVPLFTSFFIYIRLFKHQEYYPDLRILIVPFVAFLLFWLVRKKTMYFQKERYGHYVEDLKSNLNDLSQAEEK